MTNATADDAAKTVRQLRQTFTVEALAHRVGVSARTVQRWQSGEQRPSPLAQTRLEHIARRARL